MSNFLSITPPFSLPLIVASGILAPISAKLLRITGDLKAAAVYGLSSELIQQSITTSAVYACIKFSSETYKNNVSAFSGQDLNTIPLDQMTPESMQATDGDMALSLAVIFSYPAALVISTMLGKYLANQVKEGPPLTYRQIIKLELTRLTLVTLLGVLNKDLKFEAL